VLRFAVGKRGEAVRGGDGAGRERRRDWDLCAWVRDCGCVSGAASLGWECGPNEVKANSLPVVLLWTAYPHSNV